MTDIKFNKREFTAQVTSWLNVFLRDGTSAFEVVTSETSVKISGR